jgi:hypothetical protein
MSRIMHRAAPLNWVEAQGSQIRKTELTPASELALLMVVHAAQSPDRPAAWSQL